MNKILLLLYSVFVLSVAASEVEVIVSPSQPVKGEVFDVRFKVTMTADEKPFISFTPRNLEVLERVNEPEYHFEIRGGIGRAQTTKTLTYTYHMVANNPGNSYLRDIVVEIGKEKIKHKNLSIRVLSKRKEMPKIFARAEVNKKDVYLGEGFDVRYYVYSLYPILQTEIKTFPKLNGFIKRFHKTLDAEEAVRVDGKVYRRSLKYSARVYPEKTGELSIDPLRLVVQYAGGRTNPFGNFGFGFNRFSKKSLNSARVKVHVKPLPAEGVPPSFNGLVGEHEYKLIMTKNKYLVNEAIEAKLEVSGPGALEKLDAPRLFENEALEKFDDKSDFQEINEKSGRKVFEYTYLARANIDIAQRVIKLAYFDPEAEQYKFKELAIPELIIGGGGNAVIPNNHSSNGNVSGKNNLKGNLEGDRILREVPPVSMISAPLFDVSWKSIPLNWIMYLNIVLAVIFLLQLVVMVYSAAKGGSLSCKELVTMYKRVVKQGANYQTLASLIFMLEVEKNKSSDIIKTIEHSTLKNSDKKYFIKVLKELEASSYSKNKLQERKKIKASALKNLKKEIERQIYDNEAGEQINEGFKLDNRTS